MFVDFGTQREMRMRRIVISGQSGSTIYVFSTLSHKRQDFREEVTEHKMCVFIFSTTFVWRISHSKNKCERYDHKCTLVFMYCARYSCKISTKLDRFSKNTQMWNFIKLRPEEAELFHADGRTYGRTDRQTDTTKQTIAFSNFANSPKMALLTTSVQLQKMCTYCIFYHHVARSQFGFSSNGIRTVTCVGFFSVTVTHTAYFTIVRSRVRRIVLSVGNWELSLRLLLTVWC